MIEMNMEDVVRQDIISMLEAAAPAISKLDSIKLREISDHTLHNASIYQDKDSITIAVVMYALSKIVERSTIPAPEIKTKLEQARDHLENKDIENYEGTVKEIVDMISNIDRKMNLYVQRVINEAEIKKGSRLYEHGISLAQTAELLGISHWELMKYIGNTKIADKFEDEIEVMDRLNHTRRLFGL